MFGGRIKLAPDATSADFVASAKQKWTQRIVPDTISEFLRGNLDPSTVVPKGKDARRALFWATLAGMDKGPFEHLLKASFFSEASLMVLCAVLCLGVLVGYLYAYYEQRFSAWDRFLQVAEVAGHSFGAYKHQFYRQGLPASVVPVPALLGAWLSRNRWNAQIMP